MQRLTQAAASHVGLCVCVVYVCEEHKPQLQKVRGKETTAQVQSPLTLHESPKSLLWGLQNGGIRNLEEAETDSLSILYF